MMIIRPHTLHDVTSIYASMYHGRDLLGTVLIIQSFSQVPTLPTYHPSRKYISCLQLSPYGWLRLQGSGRFRIFGLAGSRTKQPLHHVLRSPYKKRYHHIAEMVIKQEHGESLIFVILGCCDEGSTPDERR